RFRFAALISGSTATALREAECASQPHTAESTVGSPALDFGTSYTPHPYIVGYPHPLCQAEGKCAAFSMLLLLTQPKSKVNVHAERAIFDAHVDSRQRQNRRNGRTRHVVRPPKPAA